MSYLTTSTIIPLFLLTMGVSPRIIPSQQDDATEALQPIASRSQARRICAELCLAGLGGRACGGDCVDLVPQQLPVVVKIDVSGSSGGSDNASEPAAFGRARTRHEACKVLCDNNLGRPLCDCENDETDAVPDYVQVCSFYCLQYEYRLYGCQKCSIYNDTYSVYSDFSVQTLKTSIRPRADYDLWCVQKCQQGDGGAACTCDILPMMKSV